MKKLYLSLIAIVFCFSISIQSFAGVFDSLADKLADKVFNEIGGNILEQKTEELEGLTNILEGQTKELESFDIDDLGKNLLIKSLDLYKKYGFKDLPDNYQNMSYKELSEWLEKEENKTKIEAWENSLSKEIKDKLNDEGNDLLKNETKDVMAVAEKIKDTVLQMQGKMTEIEPLLDNFVNGYKNWMTGVQNGTIDLKKYPEFQEALSKIQPMAEAYAKGDKIQAFKYLDEITGLFSNSEAFQGLKILLESSEAVGLHKYLAQICSKLLAFNGTKLNISEAQMEQIWDEYLKDLRQKTGVKSDSTYADKIKGLAEDYIGKIDNMQDVANLLDKFSKSKAGDFVKKQLEGKGFEALEDVISKYSGVDKETIENSGIMDIIKNTTKAVGEAGTGKGNFTDIAKNAVSDIINKFKGDKK